MKVIINEGAVIVYAECPAKGEACMCMGTCNQIEAMIPLRDWKEFLAKHTPVMPKLSSAMDKQWAGNFYNKKNDKEFQHYEDAGGIIEITLSSPLLTGVGGDCVPFNILINEDIRLLSSIITFPYKTWEGENLQAIVVGKTGPVVTCKFLRADYITDYDLDIQTKLYVR